MKMFIHIGIAACLAAGSVGAQTVETKTIELRHLAPSEAVKLLKPYVKAKDGGVFDVGENISIITLRDTPENIARMERVLAKYDHTPTTIRLVFQLIEADTGPRVSSAANFQSPVSMDLDSTLRSVLRFPTYRLLAQGVASVGEFSDVHQQLATRDSQWLYTLHAHVGAIRVNDVGIVQRTAPASANGPAEVTVAIASTVHLTVTLHRDGRNGSGPGVPGTGIVQEVPIETGLDVPIGHMVVLGTAVTRSSGAALILTVKPELVPKNH